MNPGVQGLLGSMGIGGGEPQDQINALIRKLKDSLGEQGYSVAARIGGIFGLDEQTFRQLWLNVDRSEASMKQYKSIVESAGLNQQKMAEDSARLGRALNELGSSLDVLGSKILSKLIGPMETATHFLADFTQRLAGGKLYDPKRPDFLSGLAMSSPTLSAWNAMLGNSAEGVSQVPGMLAKPPSIAFPSNPNAAGGKVARDAVVEFFKGQGWSTEQAYGIAANLSQESGFNPRMSHMDRGKPSAGLASWRADRLSDFHAWAGHDISESSAEEQLRFIQYELTEGKEQAAGRALRGAKTAHEAGSVFSYAYERPQHTLLEMANRGAQAESWFKQGATTNNINITINGPMTAETARRGVEAGLESQQRRQLSRGDNMR
jgi:hypothetical protein